MRISFQVAIFKHLGRTDGCRLMVKLFKTGGRK